MSTFFTPKELTIREVVREIGVPGLKSVRTQLGLPKRHALKEQLVEELADQLERNLESTLKALSLAEKQLVNEIAHSPRGCDPSVFRAKYPGTMVSPRDKWYTKNATISWIFYTVGDEKGWVMPPGLAARIRALLPKPPQASVRVTEEIPSRIEDKEFGFREVRVHNGSAVSLVELRQVLAWINIGKAKVTAKGLRPTPATEKAVGKVLAEPDFDLAIPDHLTEKYLNDEIAGSVRAHAWPVLLQQCGWTRMHGERLALTPEGLPMMALLRPEQFRLGVNRFLEDDNFDELRRVNHIRGQTGEAKRYLTRPSLRKMAICKSMAHWPMGKWITIDEVLRFTKASENSWQCCKWPMSLHFGSPQYGSLNDGAALDRLYLRAFFMESLGTLGLLDLAYVFPHRLKTDFSGDWGTDDDSFTSRYDGLMYVRLNALGCYCFELNDHFEVNPAGKHGLFRVLPNHDVVLLGDEKPSPAVVNTLDAIAVRISDVVWKIEKETILNSLDSGRPFYELRDFLHTHAVDDLPKQVETFLEDLERNAMVCRTCEDAALIELTDERIAAQIIHDPRTTKLCRSVGPLTVVTLKRNLKAFRSALKKMGHILPNDYAPGQ